MGLEIIVDVGGPAQEPQQFMDHGIKKDFLGGKNGETVAQVIFRLVAENRDRPGAGAVFFFLTVLQDMAHQVQILSHPFFSHIFKRYSSTMRWVLKKAVRRTQWIILSIQGLRASTLPLRLVW